MVMRLCINIIVAGFDVTSHLWCINRHARILFSRNEATMFCGRKSSVLTTSVASVNIEENHHRSSGSDRPSKKNSTGQPRQSAAACIELLRSHDQSYQIVLRLWFYWLLLNFYGLIGCREQLENNARIIHGEQIQMVARGVFRVSQTTTTTKRWEISLQRFNKSFYLSSPCCKQRCCYVCPSHSGLFIVYLRKTYHRYPSIRFTRPTA